MDCLFCKIIAGEIPGNKVYEDEYTYAFRDINPQAPVHVLIVPKKHMENVLECDAETAAHLDGRHPRRGTAGGCGQDRLPRRHQLRRGRLPIGQTPARAPAGRQEAQRNHGLSAKF